VILLANEQQKVIDHTLGYVSKKMNGNSVHRP